MPKLAQIVKRSSGSRQVCVSAFFFSDHCIKQIDSMLPWVCSVIDHRGRQNVVKTTVTHSPAARVPLLCFYDILTSSVILYWTDAWQHGIYLLNNYHGIWLYQTLLFPTPKALLHLCLHFHHHHHHHRHHHHLHLPHHHHHQQIQINLTFS